MINPYTSYFVTIIGEGWIVKRSDGTTVPRRWEKRGGAEAWCKYWNDQVLLRRMRR